MFPTGLSGTNLDGATLVSSLDGTGAVANERNLVVATQHTVVDREQLLNDLVAEPRYRRLTAIPPDTDAVPVGIERPILHVTVDAGGAVLHTLVHPDVLATHRRHGVRAGHRLAPDPAPPRG